MKRWPIVLLLFAMTPMLANCVHGLSASQTVNVRVDQALITANATYTAAVGIMASLVSTGQLHGAALDKAIVVRNAARKALDAGDVVLATAQAAQLFTLMTETTHVN